MRIKKALKDITSVVIVFCVLGNGLKWLIANASNPPDGSTRAPGDANSPNGCTTSGCHSSASVTTLSSDLSLSGLPADYVLSTLYSLTFTISNDGAGNNGFQITAIRTDNNAKVGTWSNAGSASGISGNYWEHSGPTGATSWTADWTAPGSNVGEIKFYAAANKGGAASGGNMHFNNFSIQPVPDPPANVQFTGVTVDSLTITWDLTSGNSYVTAVSSVSDFSVPTSSGTGGLNLNTTTYIELISNTTYFFKVKVSTHTDSSYSTALSTLTPSRSPAVAGFQVFNSSISITLNPSGNQPGTTLSVTTGSFETSSSSSGLSGTGNTILLLSGLSANADYTIQTRSLDFFNVPSSATIVASTATLANVPGQNSFVQVNRSSISIQWDNNGNALAPPTSYQMQISADINFTEFSSSQTFLTSASSETLSVNTSYYFKVRANNRSEGQSGFNAAIATFTLADQSSFSAFVSSEVALSSMTIRWDPKANPSTVRYRIQVSTHSDFSELVSSSETFALSLTTLTLSINTTYYFRGNALNSNNRESVFTNQAATSTWANPPASAASTYTSVGLSQIIAQWDANGNPEGTTYIAEVSTVSDFASGAVTSSTTFLVSVTTSGLAADSTFYFRVKARNFSGIETIFVDLGSTKTIAAGDATPPANISGLTALPGDVDGRVTLEWTAVGDDGITGNLNSAFYRIHGSTSDFSFFASTHSTTQFGSFDHDSGLLGISTNGVSPGTESGAFVDGLYPGTTYFFAIIFKDASDNWSFWRKTGPFNTLSSAPAQDLFLPAPTGVFASAASSRTLTIQWTNPSAPTGTDDRDQYRLYSATANFSSVGENFVHLSSQVTHPLNSATTSSLSINTTYFFKVSSLDSGDQGDGRYSIALESASVITFTTPTLAAVPGSSTFTAVNVSSITVTWGDGENPSGTLYLAEFSTSSNFTGVVTTSRTFTLSATTLTIFSNSAHYVRVKARNHQGIDSEYNSTVSTTVSAAAPATPTGFTVTAISANSITFGWSDNSADEDGFRVLNSTNGVYGATSSGVQSLTVSGLTPNLLVKARIAAFNSDGTSTGTTAISSYTLANPPGTPTLSSVKRNQATVSWSSNTNPSNVSYEITQSTDNFVFTQGVSTPIPFSSSLTSTSTTVGGLSTEQTYYFRVRAQNGGGIPTSFSSSASTVTPRVDVIISTGGTVSAGETTLQADAGVCITIETLSDGSVQQTLLSTETATVTYGNGLSLDLPAGVESKVVATANGITLTSTQTIPVRESGLTVESTSGPVTIQTSASSFSVSLGTTATQNVQIEISTAVIKTIFISLNPVSGEIKVELARSALPETSKVRVRIPESLPPTTNGIAKLGPIGIGVEILLNKPIQPSRNVPITMSYRESDISGIRSTALVVSRFDETAQQWSLLSSSLDPISRKVVGQTRHFSKFQLMAVLASEDISNVKVFPNPFRPSEGHTEIKFTNLPEGTPVRIYTLLGQLVRHLQSDSSGRAFWDGRNGAGKVVASDIYLAVIRGVGGKRILKVGVQR